MPQTLGRYTLIEKLATGGMAEIWLAGLTGPGGFSSRVVVKTILPHLAQSEEFVRMFLDEARIAARLHHPNIAQIFDLGEEHDTYYLAMEYVPGPDLRRLYRDSESRHLRLPIPIAVRILIEVAQALAYAHSAVGDDGSPLGIVHRDVSPHNVLVAYQGGAKLVDFGIAKAVDQLSNTRTGVLKGKYAYMSPEQVDGGVVDGRSDLFALGVVGFEITTGFRLFRRDNDLATIKAVQDCAIPKPSSAAPGVPAALDAILLKALSRNPADRYQTGDDLALALEEFLQSERLDGSPSHVAAYLRDLYPEPRRSESHTPAVDHESTTGERRARRKSASGSDSVESVPLHDSEPPPSLPPQPRPAPPGEVPWPSPRSRAQPAQHAPESGRQPSRAPTSQSPLAGEDRARQLAPRGPIRDPKQARREAEVEEAAAAVKKRPSATDLRDLEDEAEPGGRRLRRWLWVALRLGLALGLVALGIAALPGLKASFLKLLAGGTTEEGAGAEEGVSGPSGRLTIDCSPAARVFLGKRLLGDTPLIEVEVPAGTSKLHLINEVEALDETLEATIQADQTTVLHETFPEGTVELPVPAGHHYRVLYHEKLLGRIPGPAIQASAGTHELVLVDESSGQRESRTVTVAPREDRP